VEKWIAVGYSLKTAEISQEKKFFHSIPGKDCHKDGYSHESSSACMKEKKNPHRNRKSFQYLLSSLGCQTRTEIRVLICDLTENFVLVLNQI